MDTYKTKNKNNLTSEEQLSADTKKWLWVPCKKELFKPAYKVQDLGLEVQVQSNNLETFHNAVTYKMNPSKFDKVDDLAFLSYLNEPSVLHNLKTRFLDSLIYTYSGLFLIAINPYKTLGIYTDENKDKIINNDTRETTPHIFALANEAYKCLITNKTNQSILITGESGAGKTENTKRVIEFIAYIAGSKKDNVNSVESLLLCANPILEAFGNAKTVKNDNSSRFGKFIQLKFKNNKICGARIEKYLLEKSRVASQSKDERSYHIFYYLLKGASPSLMTEMELSGSPSDYNCLKDSCFIINDIDDAQEFQKLNNYFDQIGIKDPKKYYRWVSSVMHLSNIEFDEVNDRILIKNEKPVDSACKLLKISKIDFMKQILNPTIKAGSETVVHFRSVEEAKKVIEGFMKLIYDSLFESLVFEINSLLDKSFSDCFIGVLDIAGFEIFEKNSFEQLCINYTNEKLQQFFNHHMFILEQEIYKNECIDWNFIDFGLDLEPTIKVIEGNNPIGILSYLDEECVMPKANDLTLLDKIRSISAIEKCPFTNSFKLFHYAGQVEYEVTGWLDKNKDIHSASLHSLISKEFSTKSNDLNLKKGIFRTVSQSHRENLRRLMELLSTTNPHFVRCILPNLNKSSEIFSKKLILDQLRCNGVLEGIRISRLGFPNRITFTDFNSRYFILLNESIKDEESILQHNVSLKILNENKIDTKDYKIGNTMVFLKQGVLAEIEELRDLKIGVLASSIQRVLRMKIKLNKETIEEDRNKGILLLQKNANAAIDLLKWKWWSLFIKIKPLLEVQKNEVNLKEKEEQIKAYSEIVNRERSEKKIIEDEVFRMKKKSEELNKSLELSKLALENNENLLINFRKEKEELNNELESFRKVASELKEMLLQAEDKESKHNEQFKVLNRKIGNLETEVQSKDLINEKLKKSGGNLNSVLEVKENEIKRLNTQLEADSIKLNELKEVQEQYKKSEVKELENKKALTDKNLELQDDILMHQNALKKIKQEIDDLVFANQSLQNEIKKKQSLNSTISLENEELSNEIKTKQNVMTENTKQNQGLLLEVEFHKAKSNASEIERKNSLEQVELLQSQIQEKFLQKTGTDETIFNLQKKIKILNLNLKNFENSVTSLQKEKDEVFNENQKLMKERIEFICNSDIKEKQEKKNLQFEIQRLKLENEKLKSELSNCSSSLDEGTDGLIEKLNRQIEAEKNCRKSVEKKLLESETLYAFSENRTRELNHIISKLEEKNTSLIEDFSKNFIPKEDLNLVKKSIENLRTNLNSISELFQVNFFNAFSLKENEIKNLISTAEKFSEEKIILEKKILQMENENFINQSIAKEIDELVKSKGILKDEIDKQTAINSSNTLHIKELNEQIGKLEESFNVRESELERINDQYNERLEAVNLIEKTLKEKLELTVNVLSKAEINSTKHDDEFIKNTVVGFNRKITELTNELLDLKTIVIEKELETTRLKKEMKLIDDLRKTQDNSFINDKVFLCNQKLSEKERLVSTMIVDKNSLKALERKMQINCNCKHSGTVKLVKVAQDNKDEEIRLDNENRILLLKLKQAERQIEEQASLVENMRSCVAVLKKKNK